jgi:hypothetical protein
MLQSRAGVKSARTVTRTLAACGIDPKQGLFSEDEVQRFYEARHLIDESKYTYSQVSDHFGVADATATAPSEEPKTPASNGATHGTNPFYEQAQQAAREYVQETTDRVVKDALEQLPAILDQTFQELAASGYVQEAFARGFAEYQARYDAEAKGPRQVYESPGFSLGSGGNTLDEDEEFTDTHNQEDIVDVSNTTTFDDDDDHHDNDDPDA